jgi:Lar family restriction alleviation protein
MQKRYDWPMKDKPMPDATTPNLLPCPFCGSVDVSFHDDGIYNFVVCGNCEAAGPAFSYDETGSIDKAIAAWNQRNPWQPIETAPRGGKGSIGVPTEILVWDGYEMRVELPQVGYFPRDTHWHPLPSPPIASIPQP